MSSHTQSTLSKTEQRTEYNCVLLGSQACGKSALVSRFMDSDVYSAEYQETMLDQYKQLMYMLDSKGVRNRQVNLNIRDVGHKYARDTVVKEMDAFIVCFDITKQDSFF
jgi:GTPase SAR1 family protein